MILNILSMAAGFALVVLTLGDIFQVVVVPRSTGRRYRISFYVWRSMWRIWPAVGWRIYAADTDKREEFLAIFAPFMLIALLGVWVALLILGFALLVWGLRAGVTPAHASFATCSTSLGRRCSPLDSATLSDEPPGLGWCRY